jgi:hypothetical protein
MQEVLERLLAANIQVVPLSVSDRFVVFERQGFVALVERTEHGFGSIGSAGKLTEQGFATLVFKNGEPFFVAKHFEIAALEQDIQNLRAFQTDLEAALK